jgi:peptidoglycan-N-acetylglucosamine deacetylase
MVIWFIAAVALLTIPELFVIRAATSLDSDWFGKALRRLPAGTNRVALTFDDGPSVPYTGQILDALGERNIKATFFVCGRNVERYPDVARRIVREGHAIGNHTYSHPFLYLLGGKRVAEEIDRTQAAIEKITGVRPKLFRPPYGIRWFGLDRILRERGLKMVLWSGTGYDWKNSREQVVSSTINALEAGAVVLLHDGHAVKFGEQVNRMDTVAALPEILDQAASMGYRFSTFSDSEAG